MGRSENSKLTKLLLRFEETREKEYDIEVFRSEFREDQHCVGDIELDQHPYLIM